MRIHRGAKKHGTQFVTRKFLRLQVFGQAFLCRQAVHKQASKQHKHHPKSFHIIHLLTFKIISDILTKLQKIV
jgi:ssRNA-specific RNase YbeY (16S rRNA maturation enzyme)